MYIYICVLKVGVLEAGKIGKDLSDFYKGQTMMSRRLRQWISKTVPDNQ